MSFYTDIQRRFKSVSRYNQILRVLVKYGFEDLVHYLEEHKRVTYLQKLVPKKTRKHAADFTKWERMRLVCEELGPTFVKFGQIMSNRPDLIPMDLVFELEKLQDAVPPMSQEMAKNVVETELEDTVENLFAWFDPHVFASASMAQVHKATLRNGKRVALKIQRPGIKDVITEDIKVMYRIAHVLEKRIPSLKNFDPIGLVQNFEESIINELDFIHESINVQRFYRHINLDEGQDQYAAAPKVYNEFTTEKVLALEFMSGIKIVNLDKLKEQGFDRKSIAKKLCISYFKQIFEYGFFHADPHPGNLLVMPNGNIGYLDFGMMGNIMARDIEVFGNLFLAITNKDIQKIIRAIQQLSNGSPIDDMRKLEYEISEFVEKYYVRSIQENELSTLMLELKDIIINHNMMVPSHFFLLIRSMVTAEGVIGKLDPELDQFKLARPYLIKSVSRKFNPLKVGSKLFNSIYEMGSYMEEFPRDLRNAIHKINSGLVKVDLTHQGIDPMIFALKRVAKQLVAALVMVSLIVGATLFIIYEIRPLWGSISAIGISSFILACIIGLGMFIDLNKNEI